MHKNSKIKNLIPEEKLEAFFRECLSRFGHGGWDDCGASLDDIKWSFYHYQQFIWSVPFTGGEHDILNVRDGLEHGLCLDFKRPEAANDNYQLDLFLDYAPG